MDDSVDCPESVLGEKEREKERERCGMHDDESKNKGWWYIYAGARAKKKKRILKGWVEGDTTILDIIAERER